MPLILNIDTATEKANISLTKGGELLAVSENMEQKDHAAWLHVAIKKMMQDAGYSMQALNAVAVTAGPGSYTGLRVGMAAAKGLCFALGIPLVTVTTLKVMAFALSKHIIEPSFLLCPMIDARRMEVFMALYTHELAEIMPPCAMILDENSFSDMLQKQDIIFFGSGAEKWKEIVKSHRAQFADLPVNRGYLGVLATKKFNDHQFTDIAYSEPVYTKEFYTHTKK